MYKLLVIEDEELVRKGIVSLIDYDKLGIEAVYEAGDGNAALDIIREKQPDIKYIYFIRHLIHLSKHHIRLIIKPIAQYRGTA